MNKDQGDPWLAEALKRHGIDREVRIVAIRDRAAPDLIEREFAWIMAPQFPQGLANAHP